MEIVMRRVSELTPYDKNTKKHDAKQIENVANSIKRFGWQQPIVVDEHDVVVIGHCRLAAAKKLGMKEVPVTVAGGLTDEEIRELRIADNKTNESPWDLGMLAEDMQDLNFEGFDLELPKASDIEDWFQTRERWDDSTDGESEEYKDFLDKFEIPKTTDDCYTPDNVYQAVASWVAGEYNQAPKNFVRPFYPGGDYKAFKYLPGCVVVDNPPFSILAEILRFYTEKGIRFFLFAPALTLLTASDCDLTYLAVGSDITYENGATIHTSFITNMDDVRVRSVPDLFQTIKAANDENLRAQRKELPKYEYPDHVVTAAAINKFSKYGVDFSVCKHEAEIISSLDEQKDSDRAIFGKGLLLSDKAAAEKAAAEKAAAEKAAAEKAAAEKAAAEKASAQKWKLSEREWEIVRRLSDADK